jgi:hypothetical protein
MAGALSLVTPPGRAPAMAGASDVYALRKFVPLQPPHFPAMAGGAIIPAVFLLPTPGLLPVRAGPTTPRLNPSAVSVTSRTRLIFIGVLPFLCN